MLNPAILRKGDTPGHEFRGNQYTMSAGPLNIVRKPGSLNVSAKDGSKHADAYHYSRRRGETPEAFHTRAESIVASLIARHGVSKGDVEGHSFHGNQYTTAQRISEMKPGEKHTFHDPRMGRLAHVTRMSTAVPTYTVKVTREDGTHMSSKTGSNSTVLGQHIHDEFSSARKNAHSNLRPDWSAAGDCAHAVARVAQSKRQVLGNIRGTRATVVAGTDGFYRRFPVRTEKASRADSIKRISDLAAKYGARVARAFSSAIKELKDAVDVKAIADALARGAVDEAQRLIDASLSSHGFRALQQEFNAAVIAGAGLAAKLGHEQLFGDGNTRSVQFSFDVSDPKTTAFLQEYGASQVGEITDETRRVMRSALTEGFAAGDNPLVVARSIRSLVGLNESQAEWASNLQRIISQGTLTDGSYATFSDYAGYELRDKRFDGVVRRFLEEGEVLNADQINRITDSYASRLLDMRADTIARTEGIRAVNAGQLDMWRQANGNNRIPADLEVRRYWVFTDDDRVREAHTEIPDMNPDGVGIDEPFETPLGPLMFPGDPNGDPANTINCRCTVITQLRPREEGDDEA